MRVTAVPKRLVILAVVALTALAFGGYEAYMRMTHVYESDARVTADIITMSSRAEGWVVEMSAIEGAKVEAGQVIIRIDDRVAKLRAEALRAQILAVQADRVRLGAERHMTESQTGARTKTRTSGVQMTEAARDALDSDILLAQKDLERSRPLYERHVITDKQLETAQAAVNRLENNKRRLEAERTQAEGALAEVYAELDKLAVIDTQLAALDHVEANLQAQLRQQLIDIEDRTIKSPVPAVIDRTFVFGGEFVLSGQRILMLHNPADMWIEANIKETQLRYLKLGQIVHVGVDAYPDDRFTGRVSLIGSSTTTRFALLPTPNPSGNFTKITQRVPVRIAIVEAPRPLTPGMMVEVDVDIR